MMKETNFVGYDYITVTTDRDLEAVYIDGLPSFGWELDSRSQGLALGVSLRFKRNRKISNKAELGRLQRQFESGVEEIAHLDRSKETAASIAAYVIGVLGTACMAGSVFAFLGGLIPLCIVLAIPGFVGWALPYLCFIRIRKTKIAQIEPKIDKQYDTIYDICDQANALLA